ncbi:MAG: pyrroline-5-carboxylate reductase [Bryobacterales bacterium]|nr:pyrroline-5-carboxylate reductase [Bryobacterales bacterium]
MAGTLTLGIVGVGNLGGALAEGALAAGAVGRVVGSDVSKERLTELTERLGDQFQSATPQQATASADIVVVAVKPHLVPVVLRQIKGSLPAGSVVVSVAAGVPTAKISPSLPDRWPIVRAMPNLAMVVGASATALCANEHVSEEQLDSIETVFRSVGTTVRVDESMMHVVTGLTGSGPAYVSVLIDGLISGAVKKGLSTDLARELVVQLFYGSAKLLQETDLHPSQLRDRVTTPGGTTIAGLSELEAHAVRSALMSAVEAAAERSEELAQS